MVTVNLSAARVASFWRRVDRSSGCWLWRGYRTQSGYGMIRIATRQKSAHIVAYVLVKGPYPAGLELDHLCRNRACVNPDHLEPVTHRVNVLRGESPTALNAAKQYCPKRHLLSPDNVDHRRGGRRRCKTCRQAYQRQRWPYERERRRALQLAG